MIRLYSYNIIYYYVLKCWFYIISIIMIKYIFNYCFSIKADNIYFLFMKFNDKL